MLCRLRCASGRAFSHVASPKATSGFRCPSILSCSSVINSHLAVAIPRERCFSSTTPVEVGTAHATLPSKIGFAIDIDGTLARGKQPIPGSKECLELLDRNGIPYILLTNGGGSLESHKAASVSRVLDYEIDPAKVVLAHTPMQSLLDEYRQQLVLVVGRAAALDVMEAYGFENVVSVGDLHAQHPSVYPDVPPELATPRRSLHDGESIAAVFALMDPLAWEKELQVMCDVLRSDGRLHKHAPLHLDDLQQQPVKCFMAGPDFEYAGEAPVPRFGSGAFGFVLQSLYFKLTGRHLTSVIFGKPHKITYDWAERVLAELPQHARGMPVPAQDIPFDRLYGIGDNPLTDVEGANRAGPHWRSVLVKTGVWTAPGNHPEHPAHYVHDTIHDAIVQILEEEGFPLH